MWAGTAARYHSPKICLRYHKNKRRSFLLEQSNCNNSWYNVASGKSLRRGLDTLHKLIFSSTCLLPPTMLQRKPLQTWLEYLHYLLQNSCSLALFTLSNCAPDCPAQCCKVSSSAAMENEELHFSFCMEISFLVFIVGTLYPQYRQKRTYEKHLPHQLTVTYDHRIESMQLDPYDFMVLRRVAKVSFYFMPEVWWLWHTVALKNWNKG